MRVTAKVSNIGSIAADEVAQLYVGIPGDDTPLRQLGGCDKRMVTASEAMAFEFELTRKHLSTWDVVEQNWVLRSSECQIYVGASSRILPLEENLVLLL